ncbi:Phosphatase 2C family protein isoform 1 [Hibiscus syriacus]|uniref:Phosphatase 2C family protein isoform 1 n=1 Tax=Hibiscus syriacus TaxID=106335 RepID=A0A6A3CKC8_HIBSY|nr:BRI1 kinase inhibitor 1-like [Hibiscus syriacus]KAE8729187.1 Phosphatase 2C family protein isoform 1 [Hibiscus syriacus]
MEKVKGSADKQQSSMVVSSAPSPPSASSSPSHEFSFTISLHSSSSSSNTAKAPPSSIAIDLTPADDIFFHGHLLPLHLLSHLPVSPRSSTNSLDSFTLPIRELLDDQKPEKTSKSDRNIRSINGRQVHNNMESTAREKSKSFSLFSFTKRQKGRVDVEHKEKHKKKKMRFDVSHLLKRYVRMVRPLLFFKGKRDKLHVRRQAYSFSGNLGLRNKKEDDLMRGRRGDYSSAPASMRTSPTNSGLLVATPGFPSSTSDSTMEELQAAIQAAIAHCKNSIRGEDKLKC